MLHQTALDKLHRVEEVREEGRQLQQDNDRLRSEFPKNVTGKRLEIAMQQHEHAMAHAKTHDLAQQAAAFTAQAAQLEAELDMCRDTFVKLAEQVEEEETVMTVYYVEQCRDTLMMPKEQLLMSAEELQTVQQTIAIDRRIATQETPTAEWLKRVIKTTKIQRKEKEQELANAEERFSKLSSPM